MGVWPLPDDEERLIGSKKSLGSTGGREGPGGGGLAPCPPRVAEDPHGGEPGVPRGLHHPCQRRAGGRGSARSRSQPGPVLGRREVTRILLLQETPGKGQSWPDQPGELPQSRLAAATATQQRGVGSSTAAARGCHPPPTQAHLFSLRKRNQPGLPASWHKQSRQQIRDHSASLQQFSAPSNCLLSTAIGPGPGYCWRIRSVKIQFL